MATWEDSVIIITYDENGGRMCFRRGAIDSTEYETVSILKLIERRFNLAPLSSRDADPNINDLTHALDLLELRARPRLNLTHHLRTQKIAFACMESASCRPGFTTFIAVPAKAVRNSWRRVSRS
jgi:hypothetical protein